MTDELTRLRKSASASSLDRFLKNKKQNKTGFATGPNSPKINARGRVVANGSFGFYSNHDRISANTTGSDVAEKSKSVSNSMGKVASKSGIELTGKSSTSKRSMKFTFSVESSSDESEQSDSNTIKSSKTKGTPKKLAGHLRDRHHGNEHRRTISLTSCTIGRECGTYRAEFHSFQNATKHFNKQLPNHVHSADNINQNGHIFVWLPFINPFPNTPF